MKFSVQVEGFRDGLEPAINVSTKEAEKDFDDIGKITLEVTKDKIIAKAHGGGAQVISEIQNNSRPDNLKFQCDEEGKVTLKTEELVKSLASFDAGAKLSIDTKKGFTLKTSRKVKTVKGQKTVQESQIIPVQSQEEEVALAGIPDDFDHEIEVNRHTFIEGMDKVNFAIGFEESRPDFNTQVLFASKKKLRFVAGTGARFAIMDFTGSGLANILKTDSSVTIIFPKHHIKNLISLLKKHGEDNIVIKQYSGKSGKSDTSNTSNYPAQIVVEFEGTKFVFLKIDPDIKYPPVDKILTKDYSFRVKTPLSDWPMQVIGVQATNTETYKEESLRHNAKVSADFEEGLFSLSSITNASSERSVVFSEILKSDSHDEAKNGVGFKCNSLYLEELYKQGRDSSKDITISFDNQFASEDGKTAPILVNYPTEEDDVLTIEETFSLFFAPAL